MHIVVYGRPAPQGSKNQGPGGQMREASRYLKSWRDLVMAAALRARVADSLPTIDGPVDVSMIIATGRAPTAPPDADKLARAVLDALTKARVYKDDAQVTNLRVKKIAYLLDKCSVQHTGAEITIWRGEE